MIKQLEGQVSSLKQMMEHMLLKQGRLPGEADGTEEDVEVFEEAEATAAKYQERLEAERKAREAAAQAVDLLSFLSFVFLL